MSEDLKKLTRIFELGAKGLDNILDDIDWRKHDLEEEEKTLKAMQDSHEECPPDHFEAQEIVVRTQRQVLENEIKEADEIETELNRVKAEIERLAKEEEETKKAGEHGKTVR